MPASGSRDGPVGSLWWVKWLQAGHVQHRCRIWDGCKYRKSPAGTIQCELLPAARPLTCVSVLSVSVAVQ